MEQFTRQCEWCHLDFVTEWETKVYCSRNHKEKAHFFRKRSRRTITQTLHVRTCKGCSQKFTTRRGNQIYCGAECGQWYRQQMKAERDRQYMNQRTAAFKRRIYFKTDGYCGICHELIDLRVKYPNAKSFSVDHIVPRAAGGSHSFENLQPAHLDCNARRGDKPL